MLSSFDFLMFTCSKMAEGNMRKAEMELLGGLLMRMTHMYTHTHRTEGSETIWAKNMTWGIFSCGVNTASDGFSQKKRKKKIQCRPEMASAALSYSGGCCVRRPLEKTRTETWIAGVVLLRGFLCVLAEDRQPRHVQHRRLGIIRWRRVSRWTWVHSAQGCKKVWAGECE